MSLYVPLYHNKADAGRTGRRAVQYHVSVLNADLFHHARQPHDVLSVVSLIMCQDLRRFVANWIESILQRSVG